jgi:hypothetical protein
MTVTLRFVQGSEFTSRLIVAQEKTAMPFTPSHVEARTPDGKFYLGAHDDGGVNKRPVGYDTATSVHELLLPLAMTQAQEASFWAYLEGKLGEPYDWKAILGFVIPLHEHDKEHAICSALMTLALRACNWFPAPLAVPAHLIDPRDLLLLISGRIAISQITN